MTLDGQRWLAIATDQPAAMVRQVGRAGVSVLDRASSDVRLYVR
jgi:hypothetical protein